MRSVPRMASKDDASRREHGTQNTFPNTRRRSVKQGLRANIAERTMLIRRRWDSYIYRTRLQGSRMESQKLERASRVDSSLGLRVCWSFFRALYHICKHKVELLVCSSARLLVCSYYMRILFASVIVCAEQILYLWTSRQ